MPEFNTNEIPVRDNTKDHIASVAEALLTKYSLAAISVKMIITAAGISRTTFYRYFKDKHDVILWIYMKEAQQLIKECDTFSMLALKCYQFMNERRTFFVKALTYTQQNNLLACIDEITHTESFDRAKRYLKVDVLPDDIVCAIEFFCAGCLSTWRNWLLYEKERTPEEILDIVMSCRPDIIKPFFT